MRKACALQAGGQEIAGAERLWARGSSWHHGTSEKPRENHACGGISVSLRCEHRNISAARACELSALDAREGGARGACRWSAGTQSANARDGGAMRARNGWGRELTNKKCFGGRQVLLVGQEVPPNAKGLLAKPKKRPKINARGLVARSHTLLCRGKKCTRVLRINKTPSLKPWPATYGT